MAKSVTLESQTKKIRAWMLGLHGTYALDIGGRIGAFQALRELGGKATSQDLAKHLALDPRQVHAFCMMATTLGLFTEEKRLFSFAPYMDEILQEDKPDLPGIHTLIEIAKDYPGYPQAFTEGTRKTFAEHDPEFFSRQIQVASFRAPLIAGYALKHETIGPKLQQGGSILDVGAGGGGVLFAFADVFPDAKITGIEPLTFFSEETNKSIAKKGLTQHIRVDPCPAEKMEYEQEFDLITLVQVFHELPNDEKVNILKKCRAAINPGGRLVIVDRCLPDHGDTIEDRRFTMSIIEQWFEITWGNVVNTRTEIDEMLKRSGWEIVSQDERAVPTYWTFEAKAV